MLKKSSHSCNSKTKTQLIRELEQLKVKVADLETKDALRKYIIDELQKSESRLTEAERIANIGNWEMDIATGKSYWSDGFYHICGLEPGSLEPTAELGMQIIHPDDRERAAKELQKAIEQGKEYNIEKRILRPDGSVRTVLSRGVIIFDEQSKSTRLVGAFLDITDIKKTQEALKESQVRYKNLFENSLAGIGLGTMEGEIVDSNDSFCKMLGYKKEELNKINIKELYQNLTDRQELVKELKEKGYVKEKEVKLKRKNGQIIDLYVTINVLNINGKRFLLTNGIDVTNLKRAEAEIRQLNEELEQRVKKRTKELEKANKKLQQISITDGLTGICNRRCFNENMEREWHRAIRDKSSISLIMADIDFFKPYNDFYGHLDGDRCLKKVAGAMKRSVRRMSDFLARYGGEEFALLLPGTDIHGAILVAESIQKNIKKMNLPHEKSQVAPYVTVSIGLSSLIPRNGGKLAELIQAADNALYKAKEKGRNRIVID